MDLKGDLEFDPKLAAKIAEYTTGGFFLLLLDENGEARFVKVLESPIHNLALDRAIDIYIKQRDMYTEQVIMEQLYSDDEE